MEHIKAPDLARMPGAEVAGTAEPVRFDSFYREQYDAMLRLAVALLPNHSVAEDVVHDAFAKTYRRIGSVTDPTAYVRRCVINGSTGFFRRRAVARRHADTQQTSEQAAMGDDGSAVAATLMLSMLDRLPKRQRAALILRYHFDASELEIADALGCKPGTVKSLTARGITTLRKAEHDAQ